MNDEYWSKIDEEIANQDKRTSFLKDLKYDNSTFQESQYQQEQSTVETDKDKRNLKNKKILKNKIKTLAGTSLLIGCVALGVNTYKRYTNERNERNAISAQKEIERSVFEDSINKDFENVIFDNENLQIIVDRIPEFYRILKNTDIDELLCEYYKNPTTKARETLFNKLKGREKEFAEMNFKLLKASFADTNADTLDDYKITFVFTDKNVKNIIEDFGSTIKIKCLSNNKKVESYCNDGKSNFKEIPKKFFKLISSVAKTYNDINYYISSEDLMESLIDNYLEIKNSYLDGYTYAIHPTENKLCYAKRDENGELKYYDYYKKEINEIQKDER